MIKNMEVNTRTWDLELKGRVDRGQGDEVKAPVHYYKQMVTTQRKQGLKHHWAQSLQYTDEETEAREAGT